MRFKNKCKKFFIKIVTVIPYTYILISAFFIYVAELQRAFKNFLFVSHGILLFNLLVLLLFTAFAC